MKLTPKQSRVLRTVKMIESVMKEPPTLQNLSKFLGDRPENVRQLVIKIEAKKQLIYDGRTVRSVSNS